LISAGLGLFIYDQLSQEETHNEARKWIVNRFMRKHLHFDASGRLKKICMYEDPEKEHLHMIGGGLKPLLILPICWYLLPQDALLSLKLYQSVINEYSLRNESSSIPGTIRTNRTAIILLYILSKEFADSTVTEKVKPEIDIASEGKYFGLEEYGYFFHLFEAWPRGQPSSLLMCAEVLEAGDWQRAFLTASDFERFHAPTVCEVHYPKVGVAKAINTTEGFLELVLYVGSVASKGESTSFKVKNIPSLSRVVVFCDGEKYSNWYIEENQLIVKTSVKNQNFSIFTGFKSQQTKVEPKVVSILSDTSSL